MPDALPQASFIGFTATPIELKDAKTGTTKAGTTQPSCLVELKELDESFT